ncbi:MAG: hypothetical protein AB7E81_24275 [Hyphomicrobiaceae bacterium]
MSWDRVERDWEIVKGHVLDQWSNLTHADLDVIKGGRDRLIALLQQRYGQAREQAEREVEVWAYAVQPRLDHSTLVAEIETLKAEISRLAGSAGEAVRGEAAEAAQKASALAKEFETSIERNPMQAVLIAVGVGLILGWMTKSDGR